MKRLLLVSLLSLVLSPVGLGYQKTGGPICGWTNIGPGAPGVWARAAVDPTGSILYFASVGGGVRRSTDYGATWANFNSGLTGTAVLSLSMDAFDPNRLYAGLLTSLSPGEAPGGLFTRADDDVQWTQRSNVVPRVLTADPHAPGRAFAGLLNGPILRTIDGGTTWSPVFTGTFPVTSIVIDPSNSDNVYASTLAGSYRSTSRGDNGSWSSMLPAGAWGLAIDPADPRTLYAATNGNGVWTSSDAGTSWHELADVLPFVAFSLALDSSPAHTIIAGTTQGIWERSSADGSTWQQTGLPHRMVFSITIGSGGALYAGTSSGLAVRGLSPDFPKTWTYPDPSEGGAQAFGYGVTVDPHFGRKLFVSTLGSTPFVSHHHGRSWAPLRHGYTAFSSRAITVDPTNSDRVYSGSFYSGLFKSIDGGATWSRRDVGSGYSYVWIAVVDPVSPNIVYAGTSGEGLFKSSDYGDSWTKVQGLPTIVQGVTVDPRNDNVVFAATSAGVYRSDDGGQTWGTPTPTPILSVPAWSITIVGGDSHVVYATSKSAGVFRSLDDGKTWNAINTGITNLFMGRAAPVIIAPDDPEVLYVGSEGGGGVFKSINGGDTWFAVNVGLPDIQALSVFGLAADPHRPGTLYISGPRGVFATKTGGQ